MRNRCIGMGLALAFVAVFAGTSLAIDMGVITGSDKGTYCQFGLNMQRLVKQRDIDLSVYTSKGSVENVYAVYQRPRTQLGIVQSDVLAFVARVQTDQVLKRIAKKIKMVFPLTTRRSMCSVGKGSRISTTWRIDGSPSGGRAAGRI